MGGVYLGEGKSGGSILKRKKKWGEYTKVKKKMGEYTFEAEGRGVMSNPKNGEVHSRGRKPRHFPPPQF